MGIFAVRHIESGRAFIGWTTNLPAMLNRQRFELEHGAHRARELQKLWTELGPDAFSIESLDTLEPRDEPAWEPVDDLKALEAIWREKLGPAALFK